VRTIAGIRVKKRGKSLTKPRTPATSAALRSCARRENIQWKKGGGAPKDSISIKRGYTRNGGRLACRSLIDLSPLLQRKKSRPFNVVTSSRSFRDKRPRKGERNDGIKHFLAVRRRIREKKEGERGSENGSPSFPLGGEKGGGGYPEKKGNYSPFTSCLSEIKGVAEGGESFSSIII